MIWTFFNLGKIGNSMTPPSDLIWEKFEIGKILNTARNQGLSKLKAYKIGYRMKEWMKEWVNERMKEWISTCRYRAYRAYQKNAPPSLLNISATKYLIFKSFFSSENWDPLANFEYKTISVRLLGAEIFAKQNAILDKKILIKAQIIWFRAPTYFENNQDKNSYNIYSVSLVD